MKKTFAIVACIIILIGLLYSFVRLYDSKSEKKRIIVNYKLSKNEIDLLQDGDIILRHGYGFISDVITKKLSEEINVSHCAVLIKDDSSMNVIHSVSQSLSDYDGVQIQDLYRFINDSKKNSVIVVRYKAKKNENRGLISQFSKYYLEQKVPFDNSFDINDSTSFFCTEFIWKVFKDAYGIDIYEDKYLKGSNELMKFDVFLNPKYFEVVFSQNDCLKNY